MSLVEFTETIVKRLVSEADLVKVQRFESDEEITIEVLVAEVDMGKVIGKKGKIANSIKTLVQAKAYNDGEKKVRVNIDSF
ncbi:MAG: KH domain-containing protein [Bacilli bacterium]|nr:KH domain-containing protein [Bacilli bacterium]